MVYTNLKNTAIGLRKQGLSYSEIKAQIPVSKSTLTVWFKGLKLAPIHRSRLNKKRSEAAKRGSQKKSARILQAVEEIQKNSRKEIGKISRRELWLLGVMLYWKNGNKKDLKKGVSFSTSDPDLARFFLRWLKDIGDLKKEEICFDIFTDKESRSKDEVISYWSEITGFSEECFSHVYLYKKKAKTSILRIRVRASSMLARQIGGWISGLKNSTNNV